MVMSMFHRTASTSTRALVLALATSLGLPATAWAAPEDADEADADPAEPAELDEPADDLTEAEAEPEPELAPAPVVTSTKPPLLIDNPVVGSEKARRLRLGGAYTMIAGGAIAATGLGLTIGFTIKGNKAESDRLSIEDARANRDCATSTSSECTALRADLDANSEDIKGANQLARVGGILLVAGAATAIVGGVVYRRGVRLDDNPQQARIRISPALAGAVVSGRF
jgi:hypothetical protein